MNPICPKCQSKEYKLIYFNDGSDDIDKLSHSHLECSNCGKHYNHWNCPPEKIVKIFKHNWPIYSNNFVDK